ESAGGVLGSFGARDGAVTLRASGLRADGETLFDGPSGLAVGLDDEKAAHGELRGRAGDLTLHASFNRRDKGIPTGPFNTFGLPGTRNDDQRWFAEAAYSRDFAGLGLDVRASHDGARSDTTYAAASSALRTAEWSEGEVRLRLPEFLGNQVFIGGDLQAQWRTRLLAAGSADNHSQTVMSGYL